LAKNNDRSLLSDGLPSNFLTLLDGKKIKNLVELADSLKIMPDSMFGYHVNFQKNDFSEWVRKAFKDNKLADELSKAKNKHEIIALINKRISEAKKRSKQKTIEKKKNAKKKKSTKKVSKDREIKPEHHFVLKGGDRIKSIEELKESLKLMKDHIFNHHVNKDKNDFSNWVRDIIKDGKLAKNISNAKSKQGMIKAIERRNSKAKKNTLRTTEKKRKPKRIKEHKIENNEKIIETKQNVIKQIKEDKLRSEELNKIAGEKLIKIKNLKLVEEALRKEKKILEKEMEISFRERKIQEIEERIEEKLRNMPNKESIKKQNNLFSKDFIQGIVVGILLAFLGLIIYWKFFL